MANWVIGDVHGCSATLDALLERIGQVDSGATLIFVGDLVNRGPDSVGVLRTVRALEARASVVLGNHDLHLLSIAAGLVGPGAHDTLGDVLDAPDRDDLMDWLRRRPLLVEVDGFVVVHAGLDPGWTDVEAASAAASGEELLRGDGWRGGLAAWRSRSTQPRPAELTAIDWLTRVRAVDAQGRAVAGFAGPPSELPPGSAPWFERRQPATTRTVVFGHWARLGRHVTPRAICIDTGCVYGRSLSAVRLPDCAWLSEPVRDATSVWDD
jgi:bis(5'-nucleosyl)-tetraphosphatase (symmetrical)